MKFLNNSLKKQTQKPWIKLTIIYKLNLESEAAILVFPIIVQSKKVFPSSMHADKSLMHAEALVGKKINHANTINIVGTL